MKCFAHLLFALAFLQIVQLSALALTLRSATGFPDPNPTSGRFVVGANTGLILAGSTLNVPGVEILITQRTRIDRVAGVAVVGGIGPVPVGPARLGISSSKEAFIGNVLGGDVYFGNMTITSMELFGSPHPEWGSDFVENGKRYYVLEPLEPVILEAGDYILSNYFDVVSGQSDFNWLLSTVPTSGDLYVTRSNLSGFNVNELDDFDFGSIGFDVFGTLIPDGDYDFDGDVDGQDYLKWQSTFGSTIDLDADGNGDDVVNAADYTIWRDNYGTPLAVSTAVPEPSTLLLGLWTTILMSRNRRLNGGRHG